jgi:hypothetical protein
MDKKVLLDKAANVIDNLESSALTFSELKEKCGSQIVNSAAKGVTYAEMLKALKKNIGVAALKGVTGHTLRRVAFEFKKEAMLNNQSSEVQS